MHRFLVELQHGIRQCHLGDERLLVAVSGGADSVALLRGLQEFRAEFSLDLCIAHLNHGWRGAASDADADWVRMLAAELQVPCEIASARQIDPSSDQHNDLVEQACAEPAPRHEPRGLEEHARNLRYRFFDRAAAKLGCGTIVLAHTADDQAETVLHRFLRGTGLAGLRGMIPIRKTEAGFQLARPMLAIRRQQIEEYMEDLGQAFRTDATNQDVTLTRNRLRHVILPQLREQLNPQVDAAICRLADQARDLDEFVRGYVESLARQTVRDSQQDLCYLDVTELRRQATFIICEVFREVWQHQNWPLQAMGFDQWNRLAATVESRNTITLPNRIEARYHSDTLLVLRRLTPLE